MKTFTLINSLSIAIAVLTFAACTTAPKGELSSSANPREEITRLSNDLNSAQEADVDVLSRKDYLKSFRFLNQAKEDLANGKEQEKVIDNLRFGRESLRNAYSNAGTRRSKAPGLFQARQNAIRAGGSRSTILKKVWIELDEDLASNSDEIDNVSPAEIDKFQARYIEMEKMAVIESQLGNAKAKLNGARSDNASKNAPKALRNAEMSIKNAESSIGLNLSNPPGYKQSVAQAIGDTTYLSEVVEVMKQGGNSLTEDTAAKIVLQRRQISDLKKNLSVSEETILATESKLDEKNMALVDQEEVLKKQSMALNAAQTSVALQGAMEISRQRFSPNEADAFQQGGSLLIRLKSMNFESGRSELPTRSIVLLAKVSEVAKSLDAREIKVEGHTDSIGPSEINKILSEQRANVVATYFKANGFESTQVLSEGHGFENPIATNKSKEGRAKNRRVDIIITPSGKAVRQ